MKPGKIARYRRIDNKRTPLWRGLTVSIIMILTVGVAWLLTVHTAGQEWSIGSIGGAGDIIGAGTSIQRALGSLGTSVSLLPAGMSLWYAVGVSLIAGFAVWYSLTCAARRHATQMVVSRRRSGRR